MSLSIDTDVEALADTYARPDFGKTYEMSFSVRTDEAVADTLREHAGHEFVCDRFDADTFRDANEAIRSEGFTEARWYIPARIVEGVREWYDVRTVDFPDRLIEPGVAFDFPIWEAPDRFGADAFLVADRAIAEPPNPFVAFESPVVVREPSGVARVDTDAGFEWGPK